jgi:hypothetical protein
MAKIENKLLICREVEELSANVGPIKCGPEAWWVGRESGPILALFVGPRVTVCGPLHLALVTADRNDPGHLRFLRPGKLRNLRQHLARPLPQLLYRAKYGIPQSQPLAARATAAKQRQIAAEVKPWESAPTYMGVEEYRSKNLT